MTPGQKMLWKMRLEEAGLFAAGVAGSAGILWLAQAGLGFAMPGGLLLVGAIAGGLLFYAGFITFAALRARRGDTEKEVLSLLPLERFLADPEALIAPNQEGAAAGLNDWLRAFEKRHGPGSVWVKPHEDEPSSDQVLLVVERLEKPDREALASFGADGVSRLVKTEGKRWIPGLRPGQSVYLVVWD